jgi:hypothetical protein
MMPSGHNRVEGEGEGGWFAVDDWIECHGAVYLMECLKTGVFKFGGSSNPLSRIGSLISTLSSKGNDMVYRWSIITNGVGRLERYFAKRWKPFVVKGREWAFLPDDEVRHFRSFGSVMFHDHKPMESDVLRRMQPIEVDHPYCVSRSERNTRTFPRVCR